MQRTRAVSARGECAAGEELPVVECQRIQAVIESAGQRRLVGAWGRGSVGGGMVVASGGETVSTVSIIVALKHVSLHK
jgi:hypothetical protein